MSNVLHLLLLHGYFCWTYTSCSTGFQANPDPLFKMIPGNRSVGQSTKEIKDISLFECFFHCNVNPNCSAINLQKYYYVGGLYDKIRCDLIQIQNESGFTTLPDSQSNTFVKTSLIFNSVSTHFVNVTSQSFNVRETISVPEGWGKEYCFLHCSQLGSDCQGLQIEKSCTSNHVAKCQILDSPLPATMPLEANCMCDIHFKETGGYIEIAQGKEARASSRYNLGYAHVGNDGNASPRYGDRSCTETNYEANPWWGVDLGTNLQIHHVDVTNRGDCCHARLHDFQIGYLDHWPSGALDPSSYPLCAAYSGAVGSGATESVNCDTNNSGRYVVVQIPGSSERLTLCEVKVFLDNYV